MTLYRQGAPLSAYLEWAATGEHHLAFEKDYPYYGWVNQSRLECRYDAKVYLERAMVKSAHFIYQNGTEAKMKRAVFMYGAVAATLSVGNNTLSKLRDYKGKSVFEDCTEEDVENPIGKGGAISPRSEWLLGKLRK